jgi:hypothetical protein
MGGSRKTWAGPMFKDGIILLKEPFFKNTFDIDGSENCPIYSSAWSPLQ